MVGSTVTDCRSRTVRTVMLVVVVAVVALVGGAGTYALFSDSHSTDKAQITIASQGGGSGSQAFDDLDGDRVYDSGEPTFKKSELDDFDNASVDLVIPSGVGTLQANGPNNLSITAGSIYSEVDFATDRGSITLLAEDGEVHVDETNLSVSQDNGLVNLTASSYVSAADASFQTDAAPITIDAGGEVTASGLSATTASGAITIGTDSQLDATDATLTVDNGGATVSMKSRGDMWLNASTLATANDEVTANLTFDSATLFVEGTAIEDANDTLDYDPDGIRVVGTPASGSTSP